jgi:hypothetical protein
VLQRFDNGAAQSRGAIFVQQFEQLSRLAAGRLALGEGQVQKRFTLRSRSAPVGQRAWR